MYKALILLSCLVSSSLYGMEIVPFSKLSLDKDFDGTDFEPFVEHQSYAAAALYKTYKDQLEVKSFPRLAFKIHLGKVFDFMKQQTVDPTRLDTVVNYYQAPFELKTPDPYATTKFSLSSSISPIISDDYSEFLPLVAERGGIKPERCTTQRMQTLAPLMLETLNFCKKVYQLDQDASDVHQSRVLARLYGIRTLVEFTKAVGN